VSLAGALDLRFALSGFRARLFADRNGVDGGPPMPPLPARAFGGQRRHPRGAGRRPDWLPDRPARARTGFDRAPSAGIDS
jgi:hypothetical protein